MASLAKKVKAANKRGQKTIIKIGKDEIAAPAKLGLLVRNGMSAKTALDKMKRSLDEANAAIARIVAEKYLDTVGTAHVITDGIDCTVALREKVEVTDPDVLKEALGARYPDLVTEKVTCKPEKRLIEISADGDDPLADKVRDCLAVKVFKPSVTYKPMK